MTNEEILKRVIEKVVKNGYEKGGAIVFGQVVPLTPHSSFIFSHDFAKAFWGEEPMCEPWKKDFGEEHGNCGQIKWEWHLQQMVLEEEPLKYLEKFL